MTKGVLLMGGVKTTLAFFMNGSSSAPKSAIFIPKAHRAMTSIVKALNWLFSVFKLEYIYIENVFSIDILYYYDLASIFPSVLAMSPNLSANL